MAQWQRTRLISVRFKVQVLVFRPENASLVSGEATGLQNRQDQFDSDTMLQYNIKKGGLGMATWVVGDIHGCYDDFMKLLSRPEIDKRDRIILIGDIIDRGPDSYKMICWAMKHISQTGRYQMICGNHEDNIIRDYTRCQNRLNVSNSSHPDRPTTLDDLSISFLDCDYDFTSYMSKAGFLTVGSVKPIIEWFESLPLFKKVRVKNKDGKISSYVIAHAWYDPTFSREEIVWYRDVDDWSYSFNDDYKGKKNEILIHGHTPTPFCWQTQNKDCNDVYFRNTSIDIDCGCVFKSASGKLAAIRLEDLQVIYV